MKETITTIEVRQKLGDRLNRVLEHWIRARSLEEVVEECERAGVTIGPVYSMADVARDPHYRGRGSITTLFDPDSERTLPFPEIPIRLSGTPGKLRFPGLPMGAANGVILEDLLGYRPEEVAALKQQGAI